MSESWNIWEWIWLIFPFLNALFLIAMIRQVIWGWIAKLFAFLLPFLLYNDNWTFSFWENSFMLTQFILLGLTVWGFFNWQKQGIDGQGIDLGFRKGNDDLLDNLSIDSEEHITISRMPTQDQILVIAGIAAIGLVLIVFNAYDSYRYNILTNMSSALEIGALYLFSKRYAEAWIAMIFALSLELSWFLKFKVDIQLYSITTMVIILLAIYGLIIWWQAAKKHSL